MSTAQVDPRPAARAPGLGGEARPRRRAGLRHALRHLAWQRRPWTTTNDSPI